MIIWNWNSFRQLPSNFKSISIPSTKRLAISSTINMSTWMRKWVWRYRQIIWANCTRKSNCLWVNSNSFVYFHLRFWVNSETYKSIYIIKRTFSLINLESSNCIGYSNNMAWIGFNYLKSNCTRAAKIIHRILNFHSEYHFPSIPIFSLQNILFIYYKHLNNPFSIFLTSWLLLIHFRDIINSIIAKLLANTFIFGSYPISPCFVR